jgi:hypothetical protein
MHIQSPSLTPDVLFAPRLDPRSLTLTSSPGLRFRGSRSALTATYRLAASLSASDRQRALTLLAVRASQESEYPGDRRDEFELAAGTCPAALRIKLALGQPIVVASKASSSGPKGPGGGPPSVTRLQLGHVRAVSSTEIECYLKPSLACAAACDSDNPPVEPAFFLTTLPGSDSHAITLWSVRKGRECRLGSSHLFDLPCTRPELMSEITAQVGDQLKGLEKDLLGLDEWRLQEGLRRAFSLRALTSTCESQKGASTGQIGNQGCRVWPRPNSLSPGGYAIPRIRRASCSSELPSHR